MHHNTRNETQVFDLCTATKTFLSGFSVDSYVATDSPIYTLCLT